MDIFEEAVLTYLSAPPGRFIRPQFSIAYQNGAGGSCPDFVVLDFPKNTVYVVEVTIAANADSRTATIFSRLNERETRWFVPLQNELSQLDESFTGWRYHVTLFVRKEVCISLREKIKKENMADVSVISLDEVVFPWRWQWRGQEPDNPLE
jgi:hypothetical protein